MTRITRIDWFSWTEANDAPLFEVEPVLEGLSRDFVRGFVGRMGNALPHPNEWVHVKPNAPYMNAIQSPEVGVRIEWGRGVNTVLVMLPGRACASLQEKGMLEKLVYDKAFLCSRIDFAVDLLCSTKPAEFVNARTSKRHKNITFMQSDDGETCYVGSWKSDRFARVYRYNPPHERANWLRVEHVYKGKNARAFAHAVTLQGHDAALSSCTDVYGWGHSAWENVPTSQEIRDAFKAWKPERHTSKTLKWLEDVCIPSILRLCAEGEIENPYEWFAERIDIALTPSQNEVGETLVEGWTPETVAEALDKMVSDTPGS